MVGDGLEDEFALDLEHVADVVEDPGEVAVGQARRVVIRGLGLEVGVGRFERVARGRSCVVIHRMRW